MRPSARALILVFLTLLLAGCAHVAAPAPDRSGDSAFVTRLRALCAGARPLAPVSATLRSAVNEANAQADSDSVLSVQQRALKLTPSLSAASPLAPAITDMEAMLLDASMRYQTALTAARDGNDHRLSWAAGVARTRMSRAQHDLAEIGISRCLR